MKKSDMYRIAQICVVESERILTDAKLEVLRLLMETEDTAKWSEEYEAKQAKEKEGTENV